MFFIIVGFFSYMTEIARDLYFGIQNVDLCSALYVIVQLLTI